MIWSSCCRCGIENLDLLPVGFLILLHIMEQEMGVISETKEFQLHSLADRTETLVFVRSLLNSIKSFRLCVLRYLLTSLFRSSIAVSISND